MKSQYQIKIDKTLAETESNIAQMTAMPDNKLSKNLDIVRQQMQMAFRANQPESLELMQLWERQIIDARVIKFDAEQLRELKLKAERNSIFLAQNHTEKQLHTIHKKTTTLIKQAAVNQCTNLEQLYIEQQQQIEKSISLIQSHEEKYTIIRKLKKHIKLSAFEKHVLNLNPEWFYEMQAAE